MPLVNKVKEMEQQGLSEAEIAQSLEEQGFSPLEINQSLDQAKIKSAVNNESVDALTTSEMQPSLVETDETTEQMPIEQPQEETPQYIYPTPNYPQSPTYQEYQPYSSAETVTEIAESLIEEKLNKLRKDFLALQQFKEISETRIKSIDDRLRRIEDTIERLQATIIGKIGNYGQNLQEIKQEMGMMQESFSKALNPLIDRAREKESSGQAKKPEKQQERKERRKGDGFENYLRR